jgi:hypothetical protein
MLLRTYLPFKLLELNHFKLLQFCILAPVYPCADEQFEKDGNPIVKVLPSSADFFEGWATVPGYYSYRSTTKGMYFKCIHYNSAFCSLIFLVSRYNSIQGAVFIRALCLVLQSCKYCNI